MKPVNWKTKNTKQIACLISHLKTAGLDNSHWDKYVNIPKYSTKFRSRNFSG